MPSIHISADYNMVFGTKLSTVDESNDGNNRPRPTQSLKQSSVFLDKLSDGNSDLAKFLFVGKDGWEPSQQHGDNADEDITDNINEDEMHSMGNTKAGLFALALEPMHIRNERIIQLFEAFAIFGALFVNVVWILYEWGSSKGYGGDDTNQNVAHAFECLMAVALSSNIFLALYGAYYWIASICWSSSHEDFVLESEKALHYLHSLLLFTHHCLLGGLFLGIYCNLSPRLPATIVAASIAITVYIVAQQLCMSHAAACAPLEFYHYPSWIKMNLPGLNSIKGQESLKARAKLRAIYLKKRAYREREKLDPNFPEKKSTDNISSVADLLLTAALSLGRTDNELPNYEARLEKDWFNEVDHLKYRSVKCLSQYMPLRLAEEVHNILRKAEKDFVISD